MKTYYDKKKEYEEQDKNESLFSKSKYIKSKKSSR